MYMGKRSAIKESIGRKHVSLFEEGLGLSCKRKKTPNMRTSTVRVADQDAELICETLVEQPCAGKLHARLCAGGIR